ncbi:PEP-CTERM sorting domain-containing protein [Oceaniferula spumae]
MKHTIITKTSIAATMALSFAASASAVVVYQDTFSDTDLTSNPGTGGGIIAGTGSNTGGPLQEAGGNMSQVAASGGAGGQMVGKGVTNNSFAIAPGYTLSVTYSISNQANSGNPPYPSNSFSFGLVESSVDVATLGGFHSFSAYEGIGLNLTERSGAPLGLMYGDGTGPSNLLDGSQTVTTGTDQTMVLTVDAAGNYSFSLNGATAGTGTTAMDLSKSYKFAIYTQGSDGGSMISQVTLDVVPEPSSTALLGLGGLALIMRRRRA